MTILASKIEWIFRARQSGQARQGRWPMPATVNVRRLVFVLVIFSVGGSGGQL